MKIHKVKILTVSQKLLKVIFSKVCVSTVKDARFGEGIDPSKIMHVLIPKFKYPRSLYLQLACTGQGNCYELGQREEKDYDPIFLILKKPHHELACKRLEDLQGKTLQGKNMQVKSRDECACFSSGQNSWPNLMYPHGSLMWWSFHRCFIWFMLYYFSNM